jgi:dienelactone hydrolase
VIKLFLIMRQRYAALFFYMLPRPMRWCLILFWAFPVLCVAQTYQALALRSADGTELKAWLINPEGLSIDQRRPVVVALHGCRGLYADKGSKDGQLSARHDGIAQLLISRGYSVLFLDSFSTRGERGICGQKLSDRKIKQSHRRDDVNGTLAWLATQDWVDANRIALLGWSHGGSAVLASTDANHLGVSARLVQPSIAIAFYPGCKAALSSDYRPTAPLLMLLGDLDDWTPAAPCLELAARVQARALVYQNSHHDFDNPVGQVRFIANLPNGVQPGKGVHAGRNPSTGPKAWQEVIDTLASIWGR